MKLYELELWLDAELLEKQKQTLVNMVHDPEITSVVNTDHLMGLLHLLDAITDHVEGPYSPPIA
jgi:hypothetical protein